MKASDFVVFVAFLSLIAFLIAAGREFERVSICDTLSRGDVIRTLQCPLTP